MWRDRISYHSRHPGKSKHLYLTLFTCTVGSDMLLCGDVVPAASALHITPSTRNTGMDEGFDELAEELQEAVLAGYPDQLKKEFLSPRNLGILEEADAYASTTGACGDTIEMWVSVRDGMITDIRFMTDGCGPTIACASYVTQCARHKSISEALRIAWKAVDDYFDGLPRENKHCAKLAVDALAATLRALPATLGDRAGE
jgi:nitrogen fixation NifU-like protein